MTTDDLSGVHLERVIRHLQRRLQLVDMLRRGRTVQAMASVLDVSERTVRYWLRQLGIRRDQAGRYVGGRRG